VVDFRRLPLDTQSDERGCLKRHGHSTTPKRPFAPLPKPARLALQKKLLARHDGIAGMILAPMRGVNIVIGLADHQGRSRAQLCREAGEIKPERFAALHLASPWL
jgi:hypothetical protein